MKSVWILEVDYHSDFPRVGGWILEGAYGNHEALLKRLDELKNDPFYKGYRFSKFEVRS